MKIIIRFLGNLAGLWLADYFLGGFQIAGGWKGLIITTIVLVLLNSLVKPILKMITFPIILLTLGLFLLVINATILWLTAYFTPFVTISNVIVLFEATVIVTLVSLLITHKK